MNNTTYQRGRPGYGSTSLFGLRGMIVTFQVIGMVFALAGLVAYIVYFGDISNNISGDKNVQGRALAAMILGLLTYLAWKTFYAGMIIIRFVRNSDDGEITANRFVLSALSLNLGGLLTPFILTRLPNVPVRSTINPRWFLSRSMGMIAVVGAPCFLLVFFLSALNGGDSPLTTTQLFDKNAGAFGVTLGVLISQVVITLFAAITVAFYYQKNSHDLFTGPKNALRTFMKIIAVIWLIVVTIELFILLFFAIVRIFGALADVLNTLSDRNRGPLMLFAAVFNLMWTVAAMTYYIYTINKTIVGIWSDEGVVYGHFSGFARLEKAENGQTRQR
ncbi:hypothetical protein JN01_0629 [Entomoplasma freundtii]|uniref:Uncharacterized protein n=2 Tax=Entomoplasma freundtii TaxID=74700 RepID=A0A2K8NU92_9MOLU|nr:hypothetical protein [Entomoplasma freundtii]ATZ16331.1 hypothetical protein EFREU_v1c03050 [Entomoplasma freundtii]TDY56630.1 hypothetical protein JN01_0629 [Entomoplasma freundtii]